MAVLVECVCHRIQSLKNQKCGRCGCDLVKLKKAKERAVYWISFRLPGGKQRRERIGYSIEEARDADGKRRVQKREKRIFDILPEATMTFSELTKWYIEARADEGLRSFSDIKTDLANFNAMHGDRVVQDLRLEDLEQYQRARLKAGRAPATIDQELVNVKGMMNRALKNKKIGIHVLDPFVHVKRLLKAGANARDRVLALDEYEKLLRGAPANLGAILVVAMNTGMRRGEILGLRWPWVDRERGFIRLPASFVKEGRPKSIPINRHVARVLQDLGRVRILGRDEVFLYRGRPMKGIRRSLETACKAAGVAFGRGSGGITFHDIRRTVKSLMAEAGVDPALRNALLGHAQAGMDARYIHPSDEALRRAMDLYTAFLDGTLGEKNVNVE